MEKQIPLPIGGDIRHNSPAQIIGMIHIVSNNILLSQSDWNKKLSTPQIQISDRELIEKIHKNFKNIFNKNEDGIFDYEFPGIIAVSDKLVELDKLTSKLSFIKYLENRAILETQQYLKYGINIIQLENVGAPYYKRHEVPIVDQLIMNHIAMILRKEFPNLPIGIQLLTYADNIALEIAIRHKLFYVRGESFLFKGIRPEGETVNNGSLAKAYFMRNYINSKLGNNGIYPKIYPDIQKKHTVFMDELGSIDTWLENIGFQKIEGIIITGKHTGIAVEEKDLMKTKEFINKFYEDINISIPLISGSGVDDKNVGMYKKYMNAIIIGSYIKQNKYREQAINEDNLKKFMDAFNN